MKYVYLVNRFHLGRRADRIIQKLTEASEALGREYEVDVCETVEDARAVSDRYRDTEYIITAVGGDGTINFLVNALAGTKNVLSFVPYGTGNDFYRTCAESLADGIHEVDIVRVNDRYFINTICFGIDADIANDERFIHNLLIPKPLRFHASAVFHFLTHRRGRRLKIGWEGGTIKKECVTVVAANGRYYGGGYRVSPDGRIDDGLMELYIVEQMNRFRMAGVILSMKNAGHLHHPSLQRMQVKKAVIRCPRPIEANIDGEPITSDRFELEVIHGGIRLAVDRDFLNRLSFNR